MKTRISLLLSLLLLAASAQGEVVLERLISREHPQLYEVGKAMTVGRDGKVYVNSGGFLLRMNADGTGRVGVPIGAGLNRVAVDAKGNIATPRTPHRRRHVAFLDPKFEPLGTVGGFLSGDHMLWASPSDVQVGPSGAFYAMDQHQNRILRVELPGCRVAATYSLEKTGIKLVDTEARLGVVEAMERFYVAVNNKLYAIGFDGKVAWSIPFVLTDSEDVFDTDDEGNVYLLNTDTDAIKVFGPDSKERDPIQLQMREQLAKGGRAGQYVSLDLFGDEVFLKRHRMADRSELFQVYDRKTGALKRVIRADCEAVKVKLPDRVWTAGQPVPVDISLLVGGKETRPDWTVRIAQCNEDAWISLPLKDGKVTPPADAAGLYSLRVGYGDYMLETLVEIRQPGSRGTVNILTPLNRAYYGRGEDIPVTVIVRGAKLPADSVTVVLCPITPKGNGESPSIGSPVWTAKLPAAPAQNASVSLPAVFTAALRPGKYRLTADVPGFTVASQPLVIGSGLRQRPVFNIVQGGDGGGVLGEGDAYVGPEEVARHIRRTTRLGVNMVMSRAGYLKLNQRTGLEPFIEQLKKDPAGVAPEKAQLENTALQIVAAQGGFEIEQHMILLHMDLMVPFLRDDEPGKAGMTPRAGKSASSKAVRDISKLLLPYPAFRGWSWACNWWIDMEGSLGKATEKENEAESKAILKRFEKALEKTGKWEPEFEQLSGPWVRVLPEAQKAMDDVLQEVAPGKINAATGPYRQPWIIPPFTFADVAEVDLFLQSEQIPPPYYTPHNVDFYKRPGKRAFGHVEAGNEDGLGFAAPSVILMQAMRGAEGVGFEGPFRRRPSGRRGTSTTGMDNDPRSTGQGAVSIMRALGSTLRQYGPWLTTLEGNDHIAIVVSTRMLRTDSWSHGVLGSGLYFNRLFEAYTTCMFAHRTASFVFVEDLKPDTLKKFKAVLIVGQLLELDPPLAAALNDARDAGVAVFHDGACRKEHVAGYKPLSLAFDQLENLHQMNNDTSHWELAQFYIQRAASLVKDIGDIVPPVAKVDNPEIMLTERRNGEGRFVWAINHDMPEWHPGILWRVANYTTSKVGQKVPIDLGAKGQTVYDLFALKEVKGDVVADLQQMPARIFAVLPRPINGVKLTAPDKVKAGESFTWKLQVDGPKTSYPLHVRLLDEGGELIEESFPTGAAGTITAPMNAGEKLTLEARELISGKKSLAAISVSGASSGLAALPQSQRDRATLAAEQLYGPHVRDMAISADGGTALLNAMNWEENYYLLDTRTGAVRKQGNVGHQFSYGPVAAGKGFFLQGYDVTTGEGYHLYDLGADGTPSRRFALSGLPDRWQLWRASGVLSDRVNNFAVPPGGDWIATASTLGLVVWDQAGTKLWSQDWWKTGRKESYLLVPDKDTLVVLADMTATAYKAQTGKQLWQTKLAGLFEGGAVSKDGRTIATYSQLDSGRVYILRDGKLVNTIKVMADSLYLTPDGGHLLISFGGNELRWYSTDGGLEWAFRGDDYLIAPRISPDGKKVVVGSHNGTLYVLDDAGRTLLDRDFGAVPVATWLDGGELLVATWMGNVCRLDAAGNERWRTHLSPKTPSRLAAPPKAEVLATVKMPWGNASSEPAKLTPNLLAQTKAVFTFTQAHAPFANIGLNKPTEALVDGRLEAPEEPWVTWRLLQGLDFHKASLVVDAKRPLRVTGVTLVEDAAHPESWLRDTKIQVWDPTAEKWLDGPYLLSDSATHTHRFDKPLEGAKFRFIGTGDMSLEWRWPINNIRLAEIVFHGEVLGEEDAATSDRTK